MNPGSSHGLRIAVVFAVVLALTPTRIVSADDVVLGNYPIVNDVGLTSLGGSIRKAMSFSMPSGFNYAITSITVRLSSYQGTDLAVLQIRDHDASRNSPGSVIGALTAPLGTSAAFTDYVFTPAGSIVLLEDTPYWIHLHASGSSAFNWRGSFPNITPTGIAVFGGGNLISTNGGVNWNISTTVNTFSINGIAVPEPGSMALMGLGAFCILHRHRTQSVSRPVDR
jgi:hypothetical protein